MKISAALRNLAFGALIAVLLAVPAWPQASTASVSGTVRDQSGAVIPAATIILTNKATNVTSSTTTNEAGFYLFPGVVPGPYLLTAEEPGMQRFEGGLTVQVQQSAVVNVTLQVGQVTTNLAVKDVTPLVQEDSGALGDTLEHTRIEQLPLNGRNLTSLLQTVPGMEGTGRAMGLRDFSFEISLDGSPLMDRYNWNYLTPRQPGLDSIQEFRVETNSSSAKYARPTSIIATTKGGTNQIHGSLFETNRNSGYGVARQRQETWTKPAYMNRNEFGGSVGGPVYIPKLYNGKNKTFWFTSWEWLRQLTGITLQASLPTVQMRNGDFSQLTNAGGVPLIIYNPWSTNPKTWSRQPYPNNQIPQGEESPLAKYLLAVTPLPTLPNVNPYATTNYAGPYSNMINTATSATRIDQRFGDKDSVYGRFSVSHYQNRGQQTGVPSTDFNAVPGNTSGMIAPNWNLAGSWVHTFSPTLFNELLVTITRTKQATVTGDPNKCYDCELGLPDPFNSSQWPGLTNLAFGNSTIYQNQNSTDFNAVYGILDDNATKVIGKHELQFGFHFRADRMNLLPMQQQVGGGDSFASGATSLYDPTTSVTNPGATPNTGDQAANFYLGVGTYSNRLWRGMYYARQREYAGYFQDNWRVSPRLTLNLGLRYDVFPPMYEVHNTWTGFDPANHAVVLGAPLSTFEALGQTYPAIINRLASFGVKYETYQQAGLPAHGTNTSWDGLGPRLAFAYRAGDGAKPLVVRGGYRISYFHQELLGWANEMRQNIPQQAQFYGPWGDPTQANYSPDGIGQYWLRNAPIYIAGQNTGQGGIVEPENASSLAPGCCPVYFSEKNMPDPRVQDWNLTFEKQVGAGTVARAGYVGNHTSRLEQLYSFNEPAPTAIWYATTGTMVPTGTYAGSATRPFDNSGAYGTLAEWMNNGWGNSNGIQLELQHPYSKGHAYQVFYVMDDNFAAGGLGGAAGSVIPASNQFLPGTVPTDFATFNRLYSYQRDTTIPKHQVRWNFIVDMPVGKGKPILGNAGKWLNRLVGGWQVAGMGSLASTYLTLPTGEFPDGNQLQTYGYQYPIKDCTGTAANATSATCYPAYLWYNGYIPAYQINSVNKNGVPNGYEGIPSSYKPAFQPLLPYPADYLSRSSATDPMFPYYGTNTLWFTIQGQAQQQRAAWVGLDPLRQQYVPSVLQWGLDASAFKSVPITERVNVRFNVDCFNVLNHPGNPSAVASTGVLEVRNSGQAARVMQLTLRLTW